MVLPSRLVMVVLPLMLLMLLPITPRTCADVSRIHYVVSYSMIDNSGFLLVVVDIAGSECATHYIPVNIFSEQATVEFVNYTATGATVLGADYNAEYGFVELLACGPGTVELLFSVSNILEEQGLGAYLLVVDTSAASELGFVSFELIVGVPVKYEVSVAGVAMVDTVDEEQGVLKLRGAGLAMITLIIPLEEVTPTITPTTPTPTPTPTMPTPKPTEAPQMPQTYVILGLAVIIFAILVLIARRK